MTIAITGGSGFVGRHLADRRPDAVVVSRTTGTDITDVDALTLAFEGVDAIAHCAGINREIGDQTFERVHIEGTRAVIEAAKRAGVGRIVLLSFLRARPGTGSGYHESKWQAEELVRQSGLEYTVIKSGMIYGPGDHMVDHVTRAARTWPIFATVGFEPRFVRPVPIDDAVRVIEAALLGQIGEPTIALMGAERLTLAQAVRRIMTVAGTKPLMFPAPVWSIRALALFTEWTMRVPLVARAQAFMLAEGVDEPAPRAPEPPDAVRPRGRFTEERIRQALPAEGAFCWSDTRCGHARPAAAARS